MYIDSSDAKWLTTSAVPQTIRTIQLSIDADYTSILPPICEVQPKETDDFFSVLANEVRSPLSIINLSVEMLGTRPPAKDSAIYLEIIARNSLRINKMINEKFLNHYENAQPLSTPSPFKTMTMAHQ